MIDLPCLTVPLDEPLGTNHIHAIAPIEPMGGGITCNTGITLRRLGLSVGILSMVGRDVWGGMLRDLLEKEQISTDGLRRHPHAPTTAVVALVDNEGHRSFLTPNEKTATKSIDAAFVREQLSWISSARYFIFGYYGRMPLLEPDLPELLTEIRRTGCQTVMDGAGQEGDPDHLKRILPHLDVYVPSEAEARQLTGETDPEHMIRFFRQYQCEGILGVKLGAEGALLHHPAEGYLRLPARVPPGPIVDTIGAGDSFLAGLLTGLEKGLSVRVAGGWACAVGALSVTARGGYAGIADLDAVEAFVAE